MLSRNSLREILELVQENDGKFFIAEDNKPKIAVLDYSTYKQLTDKKTEPQPSHADQMKQQTILVTGGLGKLGSRVAALLVGQGNKVVVVDNVSTGELSRLPEGVEFIQADVRDQQSLKSICAEYAIDAVIHLAEISNHAESFESPHLYFANNVDGGLSLLKVVAEAGIKQFVYCNGFSSTSPLYQTKAIVSQSLRFYNQAFGLRSVNLVVPSVAYAEDIAAGYELESLLYDNPVAAILQSLELQDGHSLALPDVGDQTHDGTPRITVISAEDAASAIVSALKATELASETVRYSAKGVSSTLNELADATVALVNKIVPLTRVPSSILWRDVTPKLAVPLPGWQPKHATIEGIIESVISQHHSLPSSSAKTTVPLEPTVISQDVAGEQTEKIYSKPVSVSELLAGKYTPFIKPHSS